MSPAQSTDNEGEHVTLSMAWCASNNSYIGREINRTLMSFHSSSTRLIFQIAGTSSEHSSKDPQMLPDIDILRFFFPFIPFFPASAISFFDSHLCCHSLLQLTGSILCSTTANPTFSCQALGSWPPSPNTDLLTFPLSARTYRFPKLLFTCPNSSSCGHQFNVAIDHSCKALWSCAKNIIFNQRRRCQYSIKNGDVRNRKCFKVQQSSKKKGHLDWIESSSPTEGWNCRGLDQSYLEY